MVGVTLLAEARGAGLEVRAESERLIVRGPSSAESLARRLLDSKPAVLAELETEQARAGVEAIAAECTRRWARSLELDPSDSPEDRFVAEHHRAEVRRLVIERWLPAMRRWATLEHRLGRLAEDDRFLLTPGDDSQEIDQ